MRPNTAAAMPEVSADFRTFTFRIQPGIYFADDPAFKGERRELTAADYVYSIKRHYDPRWKSANLYLLENAKHPRPVGAARAGDRGEEALRLRHARSKACARSTATPSRSGWREPSPRFLYNFADGSFTGALAREVVESYGDTIGEHPVGTGPFRLAEWQRSSQIVLERNPGYREVLLRRAPARRRRRGAGDRGAAQGPPPADGRPRRDLDHRGAAAALAVAS